jgi:hypothetical protein
MAKKETTYKCVSGDCGIHNHFLDDDDARIQGWTLSSLGPQWYCPLCKHKAPHSSFADSGRQRYLEEESAIRAEENHALHVANRLLREDKVLLKKELEILTERYDAARDIIEEENRIRNPGLYGPSRKGQL